MLKDIIKKAEENGTEFNNTQWKNQDGISEVQKDAAEALKLELLLKLIQADFNVWSAFHHVKTPTEGEVRLNDWRVPEIGALVKVLMALNRNDE